MKPIFRFILITLLATSCHDPKEEKTVSTQYYQQEAESISFLNAEGDTILPGVPLIFDWNGNRKKNSVGFLNGQLGTQKIETVKGNITSNTDTIQVNRRHPYNLDSTYLLSPDTDTAIKPPRTVPVEPIIKLAIQPERKKVSQPLYKDNAHYDIRCLSTDQGLPSNEINDIKLDSRGYLWLGTGEGAALYDGRFITTFDERHGLPENFITCIEEDQDGNIWFGTRSSGIAKFDGVHFYSYNMDSVAPGRTIMDISFDKESHLWCAIQFGGFAEYDGQQFNVYQREQGIIGHRPTTSIAVDRDNNKWISNFGHGAYQVNPKGEVRRVTGKEGADLHSNWLNYVTTTSKDELIWCHWSGRVTVQTKDSAIIYSTNSLGTPLLISQAVEDNDGNIWLSASGNGLVRWDRKSDIITRFGVQEGLSSEYVGALEIDDNGGAWVALDQNGLCYIKPKSFKRDNRDNGFVKDAILGICETQPGVYYYSTDAGVIKQDSSGITQFKMGETASPDVILDNKGNLWYTSLNGGTTMIRPNMTGHRTHRYGGPYNPMALDTSSNGEVWVVGMNADLIQVDGDSVFRGYSMENNLVMQMIEDMLITDEDVFWFGSSTSGLAKIEGDSITYYTTQQNLNSIVVNELAEDSQGRIWIGTERGINYFEEGKLKTLKSTNDVLSGNIKGIVQDRNKRYWVAADGGLAALVPKSEPKKSFDLNNYNIYSFDKTNGLPVTSFMKDAIHVDSKNVLRIGTKDGLVSQDLNEVHFDTVPPSAILTNLKINGQSIDFRTLDEKDMVNSNGWSEKIKVAGVSEFWNVPTGLELPHYLNHITFEFSGLNWKDPHHLQAQYYLEGSESSWNDSRADNIAEYRNLSYGKYTFHLRTVARDGTQSEEVTYSFAIQRPWWFTWWARILYVLVLIAAVFGTVKWRTAKLKARQKQLEDQVEVATEEIRQQKEVVEQAHQSLASKNQEVIDSINYAKRIQATIMPNHQLISDLLPHNFIIYKPKDIVAGDFYWLEPIENGFLIAAADCTGHGVPGAMVSVVCNNALNRSVRVHGITDPDQILNMTREIVVDEFGQADEGVNDGMDIALCRVLNTKDGYQVDFAGANNPLWIMRNSAEELEEIKGDKQPIGVFHDPKPFTSHKVNAQKGDTIYIFTDGYSDQFGGDKGKKFKTANFKKLINHNRDMEIEKQGDFISEEFEKWKKDFEQLDDVCVIGLRF